MFWSFNAFQLEILKNITNNISTVIRHQIEKLIHAGVTL